MVTTYGKKNYDMLTNDWAFVSYHYYTIVAFITKSSKRCGLGAKRFSCFSSLYSLQRDLSSVLYIGIETAKVSRRENGEKKRALKGLPLYQPDPFVDSDGIVCVGGHLWQARLEYQESHKCDPPETAEQTVWELNQKGFWNILSHPAFVQSFSQIGWWPLLAPRTTSQTGTLKPYCNTDLPAKWLESSI